MLPTKELDCGSASTAYRRFAAWTRAGVFDRLSLELLEEPGEVGRIDYSRVSIDTVSLRAAKGGTTPAQTPPTAEEAGCKLHVAADNTGIPLAVVLTAATRTTPPCSPPYWTTCQRS